MNYLITNELSKQMNYLITNELCNIDNVPTVCHSSSCFVRRNIPKSNIDPEKHLKQSSQTLQNVRSTNFYMPRPPLTPPKPSIFKTTKLCNRNTTRSIILLLIL